MRKDSETVPQLAEAIITRDQDDIVPVLVKAAHNFGREIKEKKVLLISMTTLRQWERLCREEKKQKVKSNIKSVVANNIRKEGKARAV